MAFCTLNDLENFVKNNPFEKDYILNKDLLKLSGKVKSLEDENPSMNLQGEGTLFLSQLKVNDFIKIDNEIFQVLILFDDTLLFLDKIFYSNELLDFYIVPKEYKKTLEKYIKEKLFCIEESFFEICNSKFYNIPTTSKDENLKQANLNLALEKYKKFVLGHNQEIDFDLNTKKLKIGDYEKEVFDKKYSSSINRFNEKVQALLSKYEKSNFHKVQRYDNEFFYEKDFE